MKIHNFNNSSEKSFDSQSNLENSDSQGIVPKESTGMVKKHREDKEISIRKVANSSNFNTHEYNISIRNSLRDLAESMCDELIRVEEDIDFLEPILKLVQPETSDSNFKPVSTNKYDSRAKSNRNIRGAGPDFLFGSPSSRLPLKDSDDMHEDGEEDDDLDGVEGYKENDYEEDKNALEKANDEYERSFEYVEDDVGRESDEEKGDYRIDNNGKGDSPRKQLNLDLEGDDDRDDEEVELDVDGVEEARLWTQRRRRSL